MHPAELGRALEERGFASLYLPEHTHLPIDFAEDSPVDADQVDDAYRRTLDPWIALAVAGAVTERLGLGTGISLVAQHDPIVLAKEIATLDHLTGGRVTLGTGFGWNRPEAEHHGVDWPRRRAIAREHTLAMQALWADDVASFDGEFVRFGPSWSWPKPVQRPRVRTLVGGGAGPKLFDQVAELADGWMPFGGAGVARALPELRAAFEAHHRDPATVEIVPFGTLPNAAKLDHYAELGIQETVLRIPAGGRDEVLRTLDEYAPYVARV